VVNVSLKRPLTELQAVVSASPTRHEWYNCLGQVKRTMKAWICTTLASFFGPMQGAARLYAYQEKQGHDVFLKDLNQDAYSALLSRGYLEQAFVRAEYMLEPVKRSSFLREAPRFRWSS